MRTKARRSVARGDVLYHAGLDVIAVVESVGHAVLALNTGRGDWMFHPVGPPASYVFKIGTLDTQPKEGEQA